MVYSETFNPLYSVCILLQGPQVNSFTLPFSKLILSRENENEKLEYSVTNKERWNSRIFLLPAVFARDLATPVPHSQNQLQDFFFFKLGSEPDGGGAWVQRQVNL